MVHSRKRVTPLHLAARLPWWLGLALSAASYAGLHWLAARPYTTHFPPGRLLETLQGLALHTFASAGQYLFPALLATGALVSAIRQYQWARSVVQRPAAVDAAAMSAISWLEFELLVGEYFRQRGFTVAQRAQAGADGGVDIELERDGDRYLVQCKQWRARQVPVETVRELYGLMAAHRAAGAFVVTSGRFTRPAVAFAAGREIELIDGAALEQALADQWHAASADNAAPQPPPPAPSARRAPRAKRGEDAARAPAHPGRARSPQIRRR